MTLSRREFMVGCSAAIAAMAGGRIGNLVFADPQVAQAAGSNDILVVVFLRGGCDGMSLVSPYDNGIYVTNRGANQLVVKNPLTLNVNNPTLFPSNDPGVKSNFGLHPQAAGLKELYDSNKLAIVHACGLNNDTRSHFDAQDYIERGTPGNKNTSSGWITRHLRAVQSGGLIPALAASSATPSSLLSSSDAVVMNDIDSYDVNGPWRYTKTTNPNFNDAVLKTLEKFYSNGDLLQTTGTRTITTIKELRAKTLPAAGTGYADDGFHDALKMVAQMIKADLGLQVATVDLGGWDHHENEGVNDTWGPFYRLAKSLGDGLAAFYNDLAAYQNRLTVVVMSEFGRRLGVNASNGTDHGHGGVTLVLGGNVNGGKLHGTWPGLADLDQGQDLRITTDFRSVLGEIVVKRLGNPMLGQVFPGLNEMTYKPLGLVRAASSGLTPNFSQGLRVNLPLTLS